MPVKRIVSAMLALLLMFPGPVFAETEDACPVSPDGAHAWMASEEQGVQCAWCGAAGVLSEEETDGEALLYQGVNDPEGVKALQQWLIDRGFLQDVADGAFGPRTKRAVELFQAVAGLPVTGTCDQRTLDAIDAFDGQLEQEPEDVNRCRIEQGLPVPCPAHQALAQAAEYLLTHDGAETAFGLWQAELATLEDGAEAEIFLDAVRALYETLEEGGGDRAVCCILTHCAALCRDAR